MFQYAAAKKIAHLQSTILESDLSDYEDNDLRKYSLGCFKLDFKQASINEVNRAINNTSSELKNFTNRIRNLIHPYKYIKQPGFYFQYYSEIEKAGSYVYLDGYWQSEKYFKSVEELIRKDFAFKDILSLENKILSDKIINENSVSIHVRRGDYIANEITNDFHGSCSIAYYKNCINYIQSNVTDPCFFIFSDDPKWVTEHLKIENAQMIFVTHNSGDNHYLDMRLMSICKHNIIANSSFSWWGAWLNENPCKIVIAPDKWFNPESRWFLEHKIITSDILPDNWIKLSE